MTAEETKQLQPGDEIHWMLGKNYHKGKFVGFGRDVADMKSLIVEDSNGVQDEILHVFLIQEEDYTSGISRLNNKHKIITKGFVQNKIEKKEEISDEETSEEENNQEVNENQEKEPEKKVVIKQPKVPITSLSNNLGKVDSPRGNGSELKPNLNTLQKLMSSQGYNIERDPNKWVRYILLLPDGESTDFIFKGKVWELYNIYIEQGIQGLLNLRS
jgi:hypothetical protein